MARLVSTEIIGVARLSSAESLVGKAKLVNAEMSGRGH